MKKSSFFIFMALLPMCFISCGGDDESDNQKSQIEAAYNRVKSQIVGSWSYEAEYLASVDPYKDLGGIYNKLGWNERDPYKTLVFNTDGTLIIDFYGSKEYTYTITAVYNYNNYVDEYTDYYPFKNGGVLLTYVSDNYKKEYFMDIVNGKLILYNTYDGSPIDRYSKKQ